MAKKTSKKAATATAESMASARGSKSDAIRDYMAAHKGAMPKEIVAALKEQEDRLRDRVFRTECAVLRCAGVTARKWICPQGPSA